MEMPSAIHFFISGWMLQASFISGRSLLRSVNVKEKTQAKVTGFYANLQQAASKRKLPTFNHKLR